MASMTCLIFWLKSPSLLQTYPRLLGQFHEYFSTFYAAVDFQPDVAAWGGIDFGAGFFELAQGARNKRLRQNLGSPTSTKSRRFYPSHNPNNAKASQG